jgi:hypothetical protein
MTRQVRFVREYVIAYGVDFECDCDGDGGEHTCDGWEEARYEFDTDIYLPDYEQDVVDQWEE